MAAASVRTPESLEDAAADPPALETALGGLTPAASASLSSEPTPGAPADVEDAGDDASSAESAEKSSAGQEQGGEPDATNDDYSKTFDSPPADEAEAQSEKDVPSTSQEPSAAAGPPESVPAAPTTTGQPMQPTPVAEQLVVQAKPSDTTLAQTGDQDGGSDEAPGVDITRLVAEIAARADASSTEPPKPPMIPSASAATPLSTLPPQPQASLIAAASPSLPPKPAATAQAAHQTPPFIHPETFKRFQQGMPGGPSPTSAAPSIPMELASPSQQQSATSLTSSAFPPYNAVPFDPNLPAHLRPRPSLTPQEVQSRWEMFLEDEHRFTTEAKWDSFPDRSRIFVGNLSSDRVSKRDVFELFHPYGRLAQISIKSAYGFVQYHTLAEAEAAMHHLQNAEIKGRKIHLEYSRTQKREPDKLKGGDDHGKSRGPVSRYDSRDQPRRGRDDYRGRSPSPARGPDRRRDSGRDRPPHVDYDRQRRRSRSPDYGRRDSDSYRRRSRSPPPRYGLEPDRVDAGARRYGSDVPDVQVFMLEELDSAFVDWIQRSFTARGLKMDVMFLSPRFPRDVMIQKHVVEGVTAIVDLDRRCQATAKIPLQVFDRSGGSNNVRFEIYRDLDPNIAIELVLRAKSRNAPAPQVPGYGDSHYPQPYGTPQPPYGSAPAFPPPHTPTPPAAGRPAASELAGIVNSLDNATLQKVLATLQTTQAQGSAGAGYQQAAPPSTGTAQFDVNALISSIAASTAARPPAPPPAPINASAPSQQDFAKYQHQQYMGVAGAAPAAPPAAPSAADTNQQVQSIMAQLARYRQ